MRKVCGLGYNDSEYPVLIKEQGKVVWRCPYYARWHHMLTTAKKRGYIIAKELLSFTKYKAFLEKEGYTSDKSVLLLSAYLNIDVVGIDTIAVVNPEHMRYMTNIRFNGKTLPWVSSRNSGYVGDLIVHYPDTHRSVHRGKDMLEVHLRCLADKIEDIGHLCEQYRDSPNTYLSLLRLITYMEERLYKRLPYIPTDY